MVDITKVDLVKFAQKVYELSVPAGMGWLHAKGGGLSDADAKALVQPEGRIALDMDYVHGRGCKMMVFRQGDRLMIREPWYDHTDSQFRELLAAFNIQSPSGQEHNPSCACRQCEAAR